MSDKTSFEVQVPDMGEVRAYVHSDKAMRVRSNDGILYDGLIYSFDGQYGKHGDGWYPVSGVVVTGQAGKKVPSKTSHPIVECVTEALNAADPALLREVLKAIFDRRTKALREDIERAEKSLKEHLA